MHSSFFMLLNFSFFLKKFQPLLFSFFQLEFITLNKKLKVQVIETRGAYLQNRSYHIKMQVKIFMTVQKVEDRNHLLITCNSLLLTSHETFVQLSPSCDYTCFKLSHHNSSFLLCCNILFYALSIIHIYFLASKCSKAVIITYSY